MYRLRKWIFICILLFITTGCWDRVEIEERGFVVGAGIDMPKEPKQKEDSEAKGKPKGKQRFALTYQFVVPGQLSQSGGGATSGGKTEQAFLNMTSTGDSIFEITREFATRTSRSPFLEHLKVLLVAEDMVKKKGDFANTVDFFLRYNQTRRGTKVFIVKGSAAEAFKINPSNERLTVNYIESVSENYLKTARMLKPFPIGDLEEKLLARTSYAIPRLVLEKTEVKVAGATVFQGDENRMVGWLGEEETEGLNFLRGEIESGLIEAKMGDNIIVYEIKGSKRKMKVDVQDIDNIKFTIEMDVEGDIVESLETMDYLTYPATLKAEQRVAEEIKRLSEETVHKLKDDFKVDVIGLGEYLKGHEPKTWKKVGENWDSGKDYFSKSTIDIQVNAIVRNPGIVSESESRK